MSPSIASRRLCALTTAELFVLCSLRLIGRTVREGGGIDAPCREGFEIARLTLQHAKHLASAVSAMNEAARRPLELHDVRCAEVSGDEELMLQVVLLLQHENEFGARRVLWKMLPPAAVRIVLAHLDELAIGMVRAGLLLPQQPYTLRPCPAEALAARRLSAAAGQDIAQNTWLN
jgi:hypothetical protein